MFALTSLAIGHTQAQITTFPYFENFDGTSTWTSGGTASTWALGTPTTTDINSAFSSPNAWVTNLTGNYASNELSYVQSPVFNFTGLTAPVVEFKMNYVIQNAYTDGACLQYSTDGGTTWNHVGEAYGSILPDPYATNWYIENSIVAIDYKNGWTGNSNGWITGKYILTSTSTNLAGAPSVIFRFLFGSNASTVMQGFAFDNFMIYQQPNFDVGVTSLYSIESICEGSNDVYATIQNFGLNTITGMTINWTVNGVAQTPFTFTGALSTTQSDTIFLGSYVFAVGTTYEVVATTSSPNGQVDQVAFNDGYTVSGLTTSLSGSYTVGTGGDYATINAAITDLQNIGVCAPVTMNILPGTYTGPISVGVIPGTTATNTVTFKSSTGNNTDVTITNTGTSAINYVWNLNGCSFVSIEDMTLTNTASVTYGHVITLTGNTYGCSIKNNRINSISGTASSSSGIYTASSSKEDYLTITNNIIRKGYYGIYLYGASSTNLALGNVVSQNDVQEFYYYGINAYYHQDIIMDNNFVQTTEIGTSTTQYPLSCNYCDGASVISNNTVIDSRPSGTTYGLRVYYSDASSPTQPTLVYNNMVVVGGGITTNYGGMYLYYCANLKAYHNSVLVTSGGTTNRGAYVYGTAGTHNYELKNNSIVNISGGSGTAIYVSPAGILTSSSNNNYYSNGTNLNYLGTNIATLAAWQTTFPGDVVSIDNVYMGPFDLHSNSAMLNGAGTPIADVTTDIDGDLRSTTAPDIGADEFTPPSDDAGINGMTTPSLCAGLNNISLTIGNYGLVTLNTLTINWQVNGVLQTPFSGTSLGILSGATADLTIGSYTFANGTSYDLKFWTSNPNGNSDAYALNDTLIINGFQTALNGTYTLGTGGDLADFAALTTALNNSGICGPTIINVISGTYTGPVTLGIINGLSATNTLTIQSVSGNYADVTVQYAAAGTTDNWVLAFNGADYVTVKNITFISTTGTTYGRVVVFDMGAEYNTLDSCRIVSIGGTSSNAAGIYSTTTGVDQYNTITNCQIEYGYYGIYFNAASGSMEDGNIFTNNIIQDYYYYGFYGNYLNNTTFSGNKVVNGSTSGTNYSIRLGYSDGQSIITNNTVIATNTGTYYGIYYYYCDPDTAAPSLIANNMVSYSGGATATAYGLYVYNSAATKIYHNSIWMGSGSATASAAAYYFNSTSAPYNNPAIYWIISKNNIFESTGAGPAYYVSEGVYQQFALTSDHNNLWATGTNLTRVGSVYQTNLAGWNNYYPGDVMNIDPGFVAFGDLHVNNPDLDGVGVFVSEVTTDIDGDIRNTSTPDIGADEFTPLSFDAGVVSILGLSAICPGNYNVSAVIQNFGLDTLTSVWVHWEINGVAQTTQIWSGGVAPLETDTVLLGSVAFVNGTMYTISAHTSHPNGGSDGNASNNEYILSNIQTALNGTYTIGTGGDYPTISDAVNALTQYGICSAVVFNILPGTYNEAINLADVNGSSAANTITFQSSTGINTDVLVTFTGTSAINYVWQLNGADYVTIQNISLSNTAAATYGRVISIINTSENCVIHNNNITSITGSSSSAAGIYTTTNNNYLIISNNVIRNGYYGIYFYGVGSTNLLQNGQCLNNDIQDFYYYGLHAYYHNNLIVDGNYVKTNATGTSTTQYPLSINYADGASRISNNTVIDLRSSGTSYGLRVYYSDAVSAADPTLVYNNMVTIGGGITTVYGGMYLYYCAFLHAYNNSVLITSGSTTNRAAYVYGTSGTHSYVLKNNSLVNISGGSGTAVYVSPAALLTESSNNNYYSSGTNLNYLGANIVDLAAWQAYFPNDVVSEGSVYLSNTNLHSMSPALNNGGTPIAAVTTDIDGQLRSATTPDIGADEFVLPDHDIEAQMIYTLGEIPQGAGDNHIVKGRFKNIGVLDQYNVVLTLNVSGANSLSLTTVVDTFYSGSVRTIDFPAYTLSNLGWNTVSVSCPTDENNNNNAKSYAQLATTNMMSYADTSAVAGNGGNNDANGHIYWNRHYVNGLKQVKSMDVFIGDDVNTVGNTVYTAIMDMNNVILATSNPVTIASNQLSSYVTFTFPNPSLLNFVNEYLYAGFVQTPTVGSNYFPNGFQNENPMRLNTYFQSSNMDGSGFSEYTNNRRWMMKVYFDDPSPFDASAAAITAPVSGTCGLGMENISVDVTNFGSAAITSFSISYQVNSNTAVTETVTQTILPGATYNHTFSQAADFTALTNDSTFAVSAWTSMAGDTIVFNDSTSTSILSLIVPGIPAANGTTVVFGTPATLTASSPFYLNWYDSQLGGTSIATGDTFITPALFDTTTYWVGASTSSFSSNSMQTLWAGGNSAGGNMFDITAYNTITIDSFDVNTSASNLMEVWYRQGSYVGYVSSDAGWTLLGSYTVTSAGVGNPTRLPIGGLTIPAGETYGIYVTLTSGSLTYTNGTGSNEVYTNSDFQMVHGNGGAYFAVTNNPRVWNGRIYYSMQEIGCEGELVPVTANVSNIPLYDAGVLSINSPLSGVELSNEQICVTLQNLGANTINNFPITVEIDNGAQITEFITTPIAAGGTGTYCFNTLADLSAYDTYEICVITQLSTDGYGANDTLCTLVTNSPIPYCPSNATSTSYEEIIQVKIGNFINNSGPAFGATYTDFSNLGPVVSVSGGSTYPIRIISAYAPGYSTQYACNVKVYADWNHDGTFSETTEMVFGGATQSSDTLEGTFTVPFTALPGVHGFRVVMEETSSAANVFACGTYSWGETEDYRVQVLPPEDWDVAVLDITQPSGALIENQTSSVVASIINVGALPITSLTINYTVNGGTPVNFIWTGTLASFASMDVTLPTMTVPGGPFTICVNAILTNDAVPGNNEYCENFFASPEFDLTMLAVLTPESGCDLSNEIVSVSFKNLGNNIYNGVPLSFQTTGMSTPTTEVFSDTVLTGQTYTYTFTTPINLTSVISTEYNILSWVDYAADPVFGNDTASLLVTSTVTPAAPSANSVTIWAGQTADLAVINPASDLGYTWYTMDTVQIVQDTVYTTPVLYDTTVYLLGASSLSSGGIAITEIGIGSTDYIEIQNISSGVIDATGWVVAVSNSYTSINDVNTIYWQLGVMPAGQVLYKTDSSSDNYWGNNLFWNPGAVPSFRGYAMIIDNLGNIVDFVNWGWTDAELATFTTLVNGFTLDLTTAWSGGYINAVSDYHIRMNYDNNNATDFVNTTVGSKGVANAGMVVTAGAASACSSDLTQVTVNVQYADYDAQVVDIVSPTTGSFLGNETVSAWVYNNGLNPLSNFIMQYTVNGGNPVSQPYTDTIAPGDSVLITFTTLVDLSLFGPYDLCVTANIPNDGFPNNNTLCENVVNLNGDGILCTSAFPYGTVNDPAVYQATAFAYQSQWWSFTIPAGYSYNNVVISLCGSNFDTYLYYYTACGTTPVNSNNDFCSTQSQISLGTATLTEGTYYVRVAGNSTAFGSYTLNITGDLIPKFTITLNATNVQCNGAATGSITSSLSAGPTGTTAALPVTYEWSNGATSANINNIAAGLYYLSVTDATGWQQVAQLTVTQPDALTILVDSTQNVSVIGGNNGYAHISVTGGTAPYSYYWGNSATTQDLNGIYAGIYNVTVTDFNACTSVASIPVHSPSPWSVTPTTISHLIVIPQNALITLDGGNLTPGSFVGVFYDSAGTFACGGWAYWSGMATTLTAYGANAGQENGFNPNENFYWKVYHSGLNVQYPGTATYNTASYPQAGQFAPGGLSGITKVEAMSIVTQNITLNQGWSLFSTYISPTNPSMPAVLSPLGSCANPDKIVIVKDGNGQIYWPQYCLNFIGNVQTGKGYQIKINIPTATTTFGISGYQLAPNTPFNIAAGWSFLGYLGTTPSNIATMLAAIAPLGNPAGCTEIVKNSAGAIFWPVYSLNLIGNMIPGQGYQIKNKCTQINNFQYPLTGTKSLETIEILPQHFGRPQVTGNNMTLGIPASAWNFPTSPGDEIGVFDAAGTLIGSAVIDGNFTALSIWGKETIESSDKGSNGSAYRMVIYRSDFNSETELIMEGWEQGSDVYFDNQIAVASKISLGASSAEEWMVGQNQPNPFSNESYIPVYAPVDAFVSIKLYNSLGEIVKIIYQSELKAGHHEIKIDSDRLPKGNYYYQFISDSFVRTKYITIH